VHHRDEYLASAAARKPHSGFYGAQPVGVARVASAVGPADAKPDLDVSGGPGELVQVHVPYIPAGIEHHSSPTVQVTRSPSTWHELDGAERDVRIRRGAEIEGSCVEAWTSILAGALIR
jgi:hypothetical protein